MSFRRSEFAITALLIASWCSPAVAFANVLPAGGTVGDAVGLDITPKGVDMLLGQGIAQVPSLLQIPDSTGSQSCLLDNLTYSIYEGIPTNGINLTISSATVTPRDGGYFDLAIGGTMVGAGTDTPPGTATQSNVVTRMEYSGCTTACSMASNHFAVLRLNPMPFSVTTKLNLSLVIDPATGNPVVHATSPISRSDIQLDTTALDGAGCSGFNVIVGIAKIFIGDTVKDQIIKAVNDQLLPQVEQGFQALKYDGNVALDTTTLHVKIQPSGLSITHDGVVVGMSSAIDATTPTNCVPVDPSSGSAFSPGTFPAFGTVSPHGIAFDAAAGISDDLVNQALFAAWNGGLLCRTVTSLGSGTPLDTSLLSLAGMSGPLNRLGIADGTPVLIVIKAWTPPTGRFGGAHPLNVDVKKLELSIFTTVQERIARIVALDLDATAGVDLTFDANNQLNVTLALDPADLHGAIAYKEPIGDDAEALLNLLPTLAAQLGPQLQSAIPPLNVGNLGGMALTSPEFDVQQGVGGVPNDTLSLYTALTPAPGGCSAAGASGCGVGTGSGGCDLGNRRSANGAGVFLGLALTPFAFVALRRRRG